MSKIRNEYRSCIQTIINEYRRCIPVFKWVGWFVLAMIVWLSIPAIAMQVSLAELNAGKFISVVVFFVTTAVWGIIAAPVIRRLSGLADKALTTYYQKETNK